MHAGRKRGRAEKVAIRYDDDDNNNALSAEFVAYQH